MKINCKCGRTLNVARELAGKKIKCKNCGQKYRMPPTEQADPTIQMKAWKDEAPDAPAVSPKEVGAVPLGESFSIGWLLGAVVITLLTSVAGAMLAKYLMKAMVEEVKLQEYSDYIKLGMFWGPSLAFVLSGYIVARFSPGRTISEPAIGAAMSVAILVLLVIFQPGPVGEMLNIGKNVNLFEGGNVPLKINLFGLGMFNAALLACAGAYFGEVAQERNAV